jgi:hypothetical protein
VYCYKRLDYFWPDISGRVGAINLEQLDTLLLSLKTYWDYSNNKGLLETIRAFEKQPANKEYQLAYEL